MLGDDQGDLVDGEEETEKKEEKTTDGLEIWELFFFSSKCSFFCFKCLQKFLQLEQKITSSTGAVEEMLLMLIC